jgi:PKD repeat protein
LHFTVAASDPDGDALTYSAENLPEGASFDAETGVFDWTPAFNQAGDYANVKLIASDGHRSRFVTFTIFVENTNRAPQIVPLAPQFDIEGNPMSFLVTAGDADADAMVYSATGLPAGAAFNPLTQTFSWTPTFEQAGTYTVTFTATDPAGLSDSMQVEVRVDNVNRAPIVRTSDHSVRLGNELRFFVQASDPDLGTTLTFGGIDLPQGAAIDPATGEFTWRPGPGQTGEFLVGLTASDGEATSSQMIVLRAGIDVPLPSVVIELTPRFPVRPGSQVLVHVIADSFADVTGLSATFDGRPLALDAQGRAYVTATAPGKLLVTATATDADGLVGTATGVLKTRDPADTSAPVVVLDAAAGDPLLRDGVVTGSVLDTNLDSWILEIQRQGEDTFRTIATGGQPVDGGTLAALDVATMPNGFYVLRLTARDIGSRLARTEAVVEVRTATKRAFQLLETDLTATWAARW